MIKGSTVRIAEHGVDQLFVDRWSPRAFSGEEISTDELVRLFEAARWAPSSYNNQPWRVLYARRNTAHWNVFFNLLAEGNKLWCKDAAVLLLFVSKTTFDFNGKPCRTHSFDCGSAWENLALQATVMGLAVHGMEGFNYEKAKTELAIPEGFAVEAMVAVGKPGRKESLPAEMQKMEAPSDRRKLSETFFEGRFQSAV